MNITRIGLRSILPSQVDYVTRVVGKMRSLGLTNLVDWGHLIMYPNLFFVFASENDNPVGVFVCSVQQQTSTCHVILSYVNEERRKQGVFKQLLGDVVKSETNPYFSWSKVTFGVMDENTAMKRVMESSKAVVEAVVYSISLT